MGILAVCDKFLTFSFPSLKINFPLVGYYLWFEKHSSMHGKRNYWTEWKEKTFFCD